MIMIMLVLDAKWRGMADGNSKGVGCGRHGKLCNTSRALKGSNSLRRELLYKNRLTIQPGSFTQSSVE